MDIYFTAEETKKAIDDLAIDAVYDSVAAAAGEPGNNNNNPTAPVEANNDQSQSLFARRRLILSYLFLSCG